MVQIIRRLRTEDVPAVMRIEVSSFPIPWDESIILNIAAWDGNAPSPSGGRVIFDVAVVDDETAGYVVWETDPKTKDVHVMNLAVEETHRNRGLGTELLQYALRSFRRGEYETCWLEVRESNSRARRLYEKLGMVASGRCRMYYGNEDAIIYSMKL